MRIIVTHTMPDMDAITSVWLIKSFLSGWEEAVVHFVPAGTRMEGALPGEEVKDAIENVGSDEVMHVDTGLGPLDHHQTSDDKVCGASLTWDYVRENSSMFKNEEDSEKVQDKEEAISRMVRIVVEDDHFKQVYYEDPNNDRYEFMLSDTLDGLKLEKPEHDQYYVDFVSQNLDAILHNFENKIWAEKEIKRIGKEFDTPWGKGLGLETINDDVIKISQKMGYKVAVRKDPRKGYVRIKGHPDSGADFTKVYEQLMKLDPEATWFLHISKKMLLNGGTKNPKMKASKLSLDDIMGVVKNG